MRVTERNCRDEREICVVCELKRKFEIVFSKLKMEHQKKRRGENWSLEEKDILRQLIAESAHIIENKNTNTSTNLNKNKEWKNIMLKLNEITGKNRTDGEIKLAWKRMKLTAKSHISDCRREQQKTGGGEKPPSPTPEDLAIVAIAPHDFVININDFDSDAVIPIPTTSTQLKAGQQISTIELPIINVQSDIVEGQVLSKNKPLCSSIPAIKKRSSLKRTEEMRQCITESNIDFKKRQIEMMEVEHAYNVKIAELKIKKLELQVAILERNNNSNIE